MTGNLEPRRTCKLCHERKTGCLPVNLNPAVYCLACRRIIRAQRGPKLTVVR